MNKGMMLAVCLALPCLAGCGEYYMSTARIHEAWASNPRVAKVEMESMDGKPIENLKALRVSIPLDANTRPAMPDSPGKAVAETVRSVNGLAGNALQYGVATVFGDVAKAGMENAGGNTTINAEAAGTQSGVVVTPGAGSSAGNAPVDDHSATSISNKVSEAE